MPIFISQGKYTREAFKGMLAAPEDREQSVRELCESTGGKLIALYMTYGTYDWLTVADMPDERSMMAVLAAGLAGGGVSDTTTTLAVTPAEFKKACEQGAKLAVSYKSAGHSR
jgi:uncharacterized protein with GYD domain